MVNKALTDPIFQKIGATADSLGVEAYVVGGFVRDYYLRRPSTDIDIVVIGSGIELAQKLGREIGSHVSTFKNFGTAMLRAGDWEVEFVGARRESYRADSRKPIVEDGTMADDQQRRDFTINAMAFGLNSANFGELIDPFEGMEDMEAQTIRTPTDPDRTFSDDPLRMIRAIRFSAQLDFRIAPDTFEAIRRNRERIAIVSRERITTEFEKIMRSANPSRGLSLLDQAGLLELTFPQLARLKGVDTVRGRAHKDNFLHTLKVLDNIVPHTDNLWLRWAALLHDIGKPQTKSWDDRSGWSFHSHEVVGSKMVTTIFREQRLPLGEPMKYVQKLVFLHLRPIILSEEEVTDSAVRRMMFDAGEDIDDLMTLCRADITSANDSKVRRYLANFELVEQKMKEIEQKDSIRNFQPPITGEIIMTTYGIQPCRAIGDIKQVIKDAILDGEISNNYREAYELMARQAAGYGFAKVDDSFDPDKVEESVTLHTLPTTRPLGDPSEH